MSGWVPQAPADGDVGDLALNEWIGQAIGAASMCWQHPERAGEFDSVQAARIFEAVMTHLNQVIDGVIAGTRSERPIKHEMH